MHSWRQWAFTSTSEGAAIWFAPLLPTTHSLAAHLGTLERPTNSQGTEIPQQCSYHFPNPRMTGHHLFKLAMFKLPSIEAWRSIWSMPRCLSLQRDKPRCVCFAKWRPLLHFTSPAFLTACPSPFNVSLAPKHCAGIFLDREELMYCMHTHLCLCMCADPSNIHPSGMVLPTAWKLFGGDLHECNIDW